MSQRIAGALAGALLVIAACGGSKGGGAAATGPDPEPKKPAAALEPGSTGFPGLDWGDTIEAVMADYPAAEAEGSGVELVAEHAGRQAKISFSFAPESLIFITVSYRDVFASMATCAEAFGQVRAELDKSLGASNEDNLAAYWSSESASISLACNPLDDGTEAASLGVSYSLPESDNGSDDEM